MLRFAACLLLVSAPLAAESAADLARAVREARFDLNECYRVRELKLVKEDIQFYFTDGYLIFSKPVAGRPIAAVFSAQLDGGDGEVIVFPPDRAERQSLAAFTHSPNLDEHFRTAAFLFTGDEYAELKPQIEQSAAKKMPDIGALLDENWTPLLRTIAASYQNRLVLDLLNGSKTVGMLAAFIESPKLGNFDVVYDPLNPEQILAGQAAVRGNRTYFDTWLNFPSRSSRKNPAPQILDMALSDYRIDATIAADLSMSAVTRVKVKPAAGMPVLGFEIAPAMSISQVTVDGKPAEVLMQESMRANLVVSGNGLFVVVPPQPLEAGREYEFEFHHSGKVILDAGSHVFYVMARGNWYPAHRTQFAAYDLTFHFPKQFDLVAPGDVIDDRTEGDVRTTRRKTNVAIRGAGFNLGDYEHARVDRGGYSVDVCANRKLETALQPKPSPVAIDTGNARQRRGVFDPLKQGPAPEPVLDPKARLQLLAGDVANALEFMAAKFGPPALPHLTVSPIPGTFGQGFPGLIYLSTLSYLQNLPPGVTPGSATTDLFFEDVLQAHETAHQWWGNRVVSASYRDNWLMESLANYSALLYLEKRKGSKAVDRMLDSYRDGLLAKNEAGQIVDSAGPIVLGQRLENSQQPGGWHAITYGKGSWILHMLRRRMGDQRFLAMLAEILKRYDHEQIDTEQFRKLAAQFLPPKSEDPTLESFFDQWVYSAGIPGLKLAYTVKGVAPAVKVTGTITQSDVSEDFEALVPVEIQLGKGQSVTRWVATSAEPATFSVTLKQAPLKVALDPHNSVLRR